MLNAYRLPCLIILVAEKTVLPVKVIVVSAAFILKIKRLLPALVDKIFGQFKVLFIFSNCVKAYQVWGSTENGNCTSPRKALVSLYSVKS